jgi:hypothetical protein
VLTQNDLASERGASDMRASINPEC